MTGSEVIEEIKRLPEIERIKVLDFARTQIERQLTGQEISELARRMVNAKNSDEAERLEDDIVRGFYGGKPHA